MGATGTEIFQNDDALGFVGDLREADPRTVGDLVSAALRAVAQAEGDLDGPTVNRALVAVALLLSEFDPAVLSSAPDPDELAAWFSDLEIELNPARRQVANGAVERILLVQANEWIHLWAESGLLTEALTAVHRLRDLLADSASTE